MCGIVFTLGTTESNGESHASVNPAPHLPSTSLNLNQAGEGTAENESTWDRLVEAVEDRGPDAHDSHLQRVSNDADIQYELNAHASILHLRGETVTRQPFRAENGDFLLWNGEVFDSLPVGSNENDGQKWFDLIQSFGPSKFLASLRQIDGPYAFVYFHASSRKVWYARDPLGRRSLVVRFPRADCPLFVLTSTVPAEMTDFDEVDCSAVYSLCLDDIGTAGSEWQQNVKSHPRRYLSDALNDEDPICPFDLLDRSLPGRGDLLAMTRMFPPSPVIFPEYSALAETFLTHLEAAVRERVVSIPSSFPPPPEARIAVLFSGGLDCTTIAMIVDRVLPEGEAIDLINVSFENPRKINAKQQGDQKSRKKNRKGKGKAVDGIEGEEKEEETIESEETPLEKESEPIEDMYDVPDRLTGRASWEELCQLRPNRRWNFVEVNVPYPEMLEHRQKVIDLMKPQNTVMDLSIAIAFYFAARGQGVLAPSPRAPTTSREPYLCRARVLLSGLGADELLGGYSRHRKAYMRPLQDRIIPTSTIPYSDDNPPPPPPLPDSPEGHPQWISLIDELEMDLTRLSNRNLGRDDRVISSLSKEVRYPFLASPVVRFLTRLPVWKKCDMRFQEGCGDKLLLRTLARQLGLGEAARLKKRAIHFGARTAKMESDTTKAKGHDLLS